MKKNPHFGESGKRLLFLFHKSPFQGIFIRRQVAIFAIMKRTVFALIICLMAVVAAHGQKVRGYTARDSVMVMDFYARGFEWESINLDSAMVCYNKGLEISRKKGFLYGEVKYYFNATAVLRMRGETKLAHQQNKLATSLAIKSGNGELIGKSLINLGIGYSMLGKLDSAFLFLSKGLVKLEAIKDSHGIAVCYSNMAKIRADQSKFQESYELDKKAILLHEMGYGLYMYPQALNNLGNALWKLKRKKEAEMAFKKAYQEAQKAGDVMIQCTSLSGQAEILKANRNYQGLKTTGKEIYRIANSHNIAELKVSGLYVEMLGYYYSHDFKKALSLAHSAYSAAVRDSLWEEMERLLGTMGSIYIGLGELEKSDSVDGLRNILSREVLSEKVDQNIEVAEARLQSEIKQLQVDVLKKEKALEKAENELKTRWIMFLVLLLFLLSFLVYFIVKNHKKQEQIARQEADIQKQKWEDAENRRQIELLDSLIKGEETERTRIARDLHDGLGGLLSGVRMSIEALKMELQLAERQGNKLDSALIMLDNATAEMRSVAHNMMPDALQRFGLEKALSDFCFALSSRTAIEIHFSSQQLQLPAGHPVCIPVYRIVQELVNNALKHSQARQIIIQISQNESILLLEIEDNGVGFEPGDIENKKGSGFTNLKNRIQYLKGKLEIRSKPGSGTAFYMEIPV